MKKVVKVKKAKNKGIAAFLNRRIFIIAPSYFYAGTLTGINDSCVLLDDARFVLQSGSFEGKGIVESEKVKGGKIYVNLNAIESFFESHE